MAKVVYICGEPGSGKTTLMRKLIKHYNIDSTPLIEAGYQLVPFHANGKGLHVLGKYEDGEVFSGTDRMSMAVQPEAIKWIDSLPSGAVVLGEGDRLFTNSFMDHCVDKHDLSIYYLKTTEDVRKERYKERNSNQNETWLQGRITKIRNILGNMNLMMVIRSMPNNTIEEQQLVFDAIVKDIDNG